MKNLSTGIGAIILVVLAVVYAVFIGAFVTMKVYGYFILSQYPEFPHFTLTQWIGFLAFKNVLFFKSADYEAKEKDEENKWHNLIKAVVLPLIIWFICWLLYIIIY